MSDPNDAFVLLWLRRLESQGPGHPDTMATLANLVRGAGAGTTALSPAELPDGVTQAGVRLDGDQVDREVDLIQKAIALQDSRVAAFGPDDPRTMTATSYLAYALAFADHIDSQLEAAAVLAQDAYEGLDDAAAENDPRVGRHDVRIAELIREWVDEAMAQSAE
ncbi:hypothetical protein [Amycolatopsis sp. CA-128772]|uniref:hypothetical protein n=1 Tax=Amycolatopsis sp. CA-128772 TaxID=2073159 RepID=UPI000CD2E3A8|nr:hypothetical protein [Amycolatopsis sp. CA-128772]